MWDKGIVGFSLIECRCLGRWPIFVLCHLLTKVAHRFFSFMCMCLYTCVPSEIRKGCQILLELMTGSCEKSNLVLWKSSECSKPLGHLSSPSTQILNPVTTNEKATVRTTPRDSWATAP